MKKVAIITGGAKGIGAAIGYKLGTKGYAVVIADIDEKAGLYRLDHFTESSIDAMFVKTDVSSEIDVSNLMDKTVYIIQDTQTNHYFTSHMVQIKRACALRYDGGRYGFTSHIVQIKQVCI